MRRRDFVLLVGLSACGGHRSADASLEDGGSSSDVAATSDDTSDTSADAASISLRPCATLSPAAIHGDYCFVVTPVESGLPSTGANATVDQYALRPTTQPRGALVLFLNGSGSHPRGIVVSPDTNWYTVARSMGFHVLALSYQSIDSVGMLCQGAAAHDQCFLQTRLSILEGVYQTGAATELQGITPDEGVFARMYAALATLHRSDPGGGWDAFFDPTMAATPEAGIRWLNVLVSGHSQGGGHAALIARNHVVRRAITFSSPCDNSGGVPAAWLTNTISYATDPTTLFFGLGAPHDTTCPAFPAVWDSLNYAASARHGDAFVCAAATGHTATVGCVENADLWRQLLPAP